MKARFIFFPRRSVAFAFTVDLYAYRGRTAEEAAKDILASALEMLPKRAQPPRPDDMLHVNPPDMFRPL